MFRRLLLPWALVAAACGPGQDLPLAPTSGPKLGPPPSTGNAPPSVVITSPDDGAVLPPGTPVVVSADFTDPDPGDTHTCSIDWQIGATPGTVTGSNGAGSCTGSFTYTVEGTYTIEVAVIDAMGGTATDEITITIATTAAPPPPSPEPSGSRLHGQGRFQLIRGGYAKSSAGGWAQFVVAARISPENGRLKGRLVATFVGPRITFRSTAVESLTITGPMAVLAGTGRINGKGNYRFTAWAVDGQRPGGDGTDRIRIQVWTDSGVVLDTQPPTQRAAGPTTPVERGGIRIE